jgi:competence protein ComEC
LWLLIWDKSFLSRWLYEQFIHSGLVHIIVVSGWNIMFLVIFLSIVLFFIPFYPRLIVIMFWVLFYAVLVGWDSSVIRATIMWLLSLLALFLWKLADVKRLLAIACMLMLIYNPYFFWYDLWFTLSFLAILWILVFNRFIQEKTDSKLKNSLIYFYNNYVLPTLGATLFVSPAILIFTWKVNLFAFFASVFVVPLVPLLMLDSLAVLFVSSLSTWLWNIFLQISIYIMDYIFFMSYLFGEKFVYFVGLTPGLIF